MKTYCFKKTAKNNRYTLTSDGTPLKEANQYLRTLETMGLSPHTTRAYGFDLLYLFRWLQEVGKIFADLIQLDLVDFIKYQKQDNAKPRSINRRLVTCESYYRYCYDKPITSSSGISYPAPYYKGPGKDRKHGVFNIQKPSQLRLRVKIPKTLIKTLTVSEVNTFLQNVTRYRDISIVLSMLMCGLRSCEILSFDMDGIDLENSQIKIIGKGDKERVVPFPKKLADVIQKYLLFERPDDCQHKKIFVALQGSHRGQPMTRDGLRSLFRYRRMKSGVQEARPHRWRHTFGTEMARAGVSYQVLQKIMGHAEGSAITNQYIHLSMSDVANEYEQAMQRIQKNYEVDKVII